VGPGAAAGELPEEQGRLGGGPVAETEEPQAPGRAAVPHHRRGHLARLAGRVAGGEHIGGRAAEIGVKSRCFGVLDRDHNVRAVVGSAGQRGEAGGQ